LSRSPAADYNERAKPDISDSQGKHEEAKEMHQQTPVLREVLVHENITRDYI
jgi:hypothetical protein